MDDVGYCSSAVSGTALSVPCLCACLRGCARSDALNACSQAASASSPVLEEGVINITDNGCQTCDPCSLVRGRHALAYCYEQARSAAY